MDFIEKLGDTITEKGREAADKAKVLAEIAKLKSQISTCEEVVRKNYLEIGRLYYENCSNMPEGMTDDCTETFEKQCRAIYNAKQGIEALQEKIWELKGI